MIGHSIILLQELNIILSKDIKDSAVFQSKVLIISSGLSSDYFKDVQGIE